MAAGCSRYRPPISCGCASTSANCMPSGESTHQTAPRKPPLPQGMPIGTYSRRMTSHQESSWRGGGQDCVVKCQAFTWLPRLESAEPAATRRLHPYFIARAHGALLSGQCCLAVDQNTASGAGYTPLHAFGLGAQTTWNGIEQPFASGPHAEANALPIAATAFAAAAGPGRELLAGEFNRDRSLEHFNRYRGDAGRIAGCRQTVLGGTGSHAARVVEHRADEGFAGFVPALYLNGPDRTGAFRHDTFRHHLAKRFQNRKRHVHADHVARIDGHRVLGIEDAIGLQLDPDRRQAAGVVGQIRVEHAAHREAAVGMRVSRNDVDAELAGTGAAREVDHDLAGLGIDRHCGAEFDDITARHIEGGLAVMRTGWQFPNRLARGLLGAGQDLVCELPDVIQAAAGAHGVEPRGTHLAARDLGREIAEYRVRCTDVATDDPVQRVVRLAALVQLALRNSEPPLVHWEYRNPDPLLVNVARAGADAVAADVGVMDGRAVVADQPVLAKNRGQNRDIEEVAGRQPRIIRNQHIAGINLRWRNHIDHVARRDTERIDVARRAGDGLRNHAGLGVEQRGGQIAGLAHHRAESDALQCLRLLADDADQVAPHDLEIDAIHVRPPDTVASL